MKFFTVLTFIFSISGCVGEVKQKELNNLIGYCSDKEGVYSISVYTDNTHVVFCKNGDRRASHGKTN